MKENEKTIYINGNGIIIDENGRIEENELHYSEKYGGDIHSHHFRNNEDTCHKIIATISPYKIEGVSMIEQASTLPDVPMVEDEEEDIYDAVISYRKNHPELEQPQQTQGKLSVRDIFYNNTDCYADTGKDGDVIPAITIDKLIEVFEKYTERFNQPTQVLSDAELDDIADRICISSDLLHITDLKIHIKSIIKEAQSLKGNGFSLEDIDKCWEQGKKEGLYTASVLVGSKQGDLPIKPISKTEYIQSLTPKP